MSVSMVIVVAVMMSLAPFVSISINGLCTTPQFMTFTPSHTLTFLSANISHAFCILQIREGKLPTDRRALNKYSS